LISIIVPNFNKSIYIIDTLLSIDNQDFINWECIIIDDNSTDNSVSLINNFIKSKSKFNLIVNDKNYGASYCRNLGTKNSNGNYIMFLDSDDIISSNCFSNRFYQLSTNQELDFAVFPMGTFYELVGDNINKWDNFKGNHLKRFLSHDLPWGICSVLWKKQSLNQLGGFNEDFMRLQDVELHTKAILNSYSYNCFSFNNPDCFYRINNNRIKDFLQHCLNDINGKISYIDYFNNIVSGNFSIKNLRGTYFECYCFAFNLYQINKISKSNLLIILSKINRTNFNNIFNIYSNVIIKFYSFLRLNRIYFRGMDKFFKYIYLL
tara:strand:- start:645 stop:1604 length:960 start_codon:yes stop_codon:yes gene_type:complete